MKIFTPYDERGRSEYIFFSEHDWLPMVPTQLPGSWASPIFYEGFQLHFISTYSPIRGHANFYIIFSWCSRCFLLLGDLGLSVWRNAFLLPPIELTNGSYALCYYYNSLENGPVKTWGLVCDMKTQLREKISSTRSRKLHKTQAPRPELLLQLSIARCLHAAVVLNNFLTYYNTTSPILQEYRPPFSSLGCTLHPAPGTPHLPHLALAPLRAPQVTRMTSGAWG